MFHYMGNLLRESTVSLHIKIIDSFVNDINVDAALLLKLLPRDAGILGFKLFWTPAVWMFLITVIYLKLKLEMGGKVRWSSHSSIRMRRCLVAAKSIVNSDRFWQSGIWIEFAINVPRVFFAAIRHATRCRFGECEMRLNRCYLSKIINDIHVHM